MEHVHLAVLAQIVKVFISLAEGWMLESELVYNRMHNAYRSDPFVVMIESLQFQPSKQKRKEKQKAQS